MAWGPPPSRVVWAVCGGVVRLQFEALQAQIGEKDRANWVNSVYFAIEFHEI